MNKEILIVDDERTLREGLKRLLSGEGHAVRTARDGADALAKIAERRPDLVLLDVPHGTHHPDGLAIQVAPEQLFGRSGFRRRQLAARDERDPVGLRHLRIPRAVQRRQMSANPDPIAPLQPEGDGFVQLRVEQAGARIVPDGQPEGPFGTGGKDLYGQVECLIRAGVLCERTGPHGFGGAESAAVDGAGNRQDRAKKNSEPHTDAIIALLLRLPSTPLLWGLPAVGDFPYNTAKGESL